MVIYSHSRLSTFEQCPYKFKLRYIDKIIPEIENTIESYLGGIVHETLEWVYIETKNGGVPTIDSMIVYYSELWEKEFKPETRIVRKNMSAKDYFNKGIKFLLDYYMRHSPFRDGTIEVEKKIIIELDENSKLQGFIDRFVYNDENEEYEIHDYKTANSLPSREKIDSDRQLALYSIAIKEKYGYDKEVVLIWHYLAHDTKIVSRRTNEQLEELKVKIIELIRKVEATINFPPMKSALCGWCEYKNMCPKFGGCVTENQKTLCE